MERLRQLRKERGLSQAKLAVMADMDPATLNRLEQGKGNPNLKTLERVADALGVEVVDLLGKAERRLSLEPTLNDVLAEAEERHRKEQYWEGLAKYRSELLEEAAALWDTQLEKGQYDTQTLKAMESVGFRLALNHSLEEEEMKRWLTPEQRQEIERAEKRYEDHARNIMATLRRLVEQEKKAIGEGQITELARYVEEREAARRRMGRTA